MQAAVSLMISSSEKQDESRLENRLSLGRQKQGSVMERMGGAAGRSGCSDSGLGSAVVVRTVSKCINFLWLLKQITESVA